MLPSENRDALEILFEIESVLRALISELLEVKRGPRWFKHYTNEKCQTRIREGIKAERAAVWTESYLFTPAYYLDFPNYLEIITRNDNWNDIFRELFKTTDILSGHLRQLEPIRNKIAHNRIATSRDVAVLDESRNYLKQVLGVEDYATLTSRIPTQTTFKNDVIVMCETIVGLLAALESLSKTHLVENFALLAKRWWVSDVILDSRAVDEIDALTALLSDYNRLPRSRGSGYTLRVFVETKSLKDRLDGLYTMLITFAD